MVPLFNEEESLPELMAWIDQVLEGRNYEVVFVDDGSTDGSWEAVRRLKGTFGDKVVGVSFARNHGKSAALHTGFRLVRGRVVITMDADLQDSPDEVPELERKVLEEGFDLVSGWKKKRYDPLTKTVPTKLYNWATRRVSGIHLHDFNCGLKAYRREVVRAVEVNGEMHRYIPVLAKQAGFHRIGEQVVQHRARKYGETNGLERVRERLPRPADHRVPGPIRTQTDAPVRCARYAHVRWWIRALRGDWWIQALGNEPGHRSQEHRGHQCLYVALVCMVMGLQLFLAGFLGESVTRNAPGRNHYLLKDQGLIRTAVRR